MSASSLMTAVHTTPYALQHCMRRARACWPSLLHRRQADVRGGIKLAWIYDLLLLRVRHATADLRCELGREGPVRPDHVVRVGLRTKEAHQAVEDLGLWASEQ
jgi:hypothetical protein